MKNRSTLNPLYSSDSKMSTLANSEDPDEMPHNVAISSGSTLLVRQKVSSEKEIHFYMEIRACDPSIYTMDHPNYIGSNQKEESISA